MPWAHQKSMLFCVSCPNFKIVLYNLKAHINQTFYSAVLQKLVWITNLGVCVCVAGPLDPPLFTFLFCLERKVWFLPEVAPTTGVRYNNML